MGIRPTLTLRDRARADRRSSLRRRRAAVERAGRGAPALAPRRLRHAARGRRRRRPAAVADARRPPAGEGDVRDRRIGRRSAHGRLSHRARTALQISVRSGVRGRHAASIPTTRRDRRAAESRAAAVHRSARGHRPARSAITASRAISRPRSTRRDTSSRGDRARRAAGSGGSALRRFGASRPRETASIRRDALVSQLPVVAGDPFLPSAAEQCARADPRRSTGSRATTTCDPTTRWRSIAT